MDVWINKNNSIRSLDKPDVQIVSPVDPKLEAIYDKDEENFGVPASSIRLLEERTIKSEPMSPPAATEDISSVDSSFLPKSPVSEPSNTRRDSKSTPQRLVLSPSKGSRSISPPSKQVPSPSKVSSKAATSGVLVSSPLTVALRPTAPVVPSQSTSQPKPVLTSQPVPLLKPASIQPVHLLKQDASTVSQPVPLSAAIISHQSKPAASTVVPSQPVEQKRAATVSGIPITEATMTVSSKILVSSPSKVLFKPGLPPSTQLKLTPAVSGSLASNPSKVLILNRPALGPKPTTSSAMKTEVVVSPSVQSAIPAPNVTGNQFLTASGQVIKVISPSKVVPNSHSTAQTISTSTAKTVTTNQAVPHVNSGQPVSLVKYKAPDGSVRFLQVSQINTPRSGVQPQSLPAIRPRQVMVQSAANTNPSVSLPVQRNPSPVVRLPTPSNVTPTQNQGQLLMVRNRDGKIYLVRPSPVVRQPAQQTVVRVPQASGQLPVKPETQTVFVSPTPSTTTSSSMPALVNSVRGVASTKLRPLVRAPQAAQRQGVSLLKSNVLQQSPLSSPTVSPVNSPCASPSPKTISHRVILPKPTISPVSASTYRSKLYKQMLR